MTDEQKERRALVTGLVGEKHMHRYLGSPHFKTAIDTLVQMLPLMVDGLAADADLKSDEMDKRLVDSMRIRGL